jgi:hypothetical protein
MGGSVAAVPVGICDAAGAHSKTVDKAATAEGTTRLGDNLMTMSFPIRDGNAVPVSARYHAFQIGQLKVEEMDESIAPGASKNERPRCSL